MTADELARLKAAEDVCIVYGWTSDHSETEHGKALFQLWTRWVDLVPDGFLHPGEHPDLDDATLAELAAERDRQREETLQRIKARRR